MEKDVREIHVDMIRPDPDQPRKFFDKAKLVILGNQLLAEGQLQDLEGHFDPENPGVVILTDGQRRWEAARNKGIKTLRVNIFEPKNPADKLMRQLGFNSGEPMSIMEYVNAYKKAVDELGMDTSEISERMGVSRDVIEKDLPLADLNPTVAKAVDKGEITKDVARKIATLPVDKHYHAYCRAVKGRNGKAMMANVEVYIRQVNQQKLWDDEGVPTDEAMLAGQKLVSFMQTFTKLHKDGHLNGRLKSAVKARSRRTDDFKEFAKALGRFSTDLEKMCLNYEAMAKANAAAVAA